MLHVIGRLVCIIVVLGLQWSFGEFEPIFGSKVPTVQGLLIWSDLFWRTWQLGRVGVGKNKTLWLVYDCWAEKAWEPHRCALCVAAECTIKLAAIAYASLYANSVVSSAEIDVCIRGKPRSPFDGYHRLVQFAVKWQTDGKLSWKQS